ncbi:hypothetical protein [Salmonella enterica]|uniref:Uncharacterized protein n=1 Tax=Salmonella phage LPST10 TaxID=1973454 RepID=A0A1W6DY27_9CAUD|nr:hypothetical protein [Salmonella enterica]YP_010053834.1 hypothetical protein KGB45_gp69 [Salmonella phage LPST10]ARK07801.1 hypothetical protein LPST10_00069 [Salmonella phage LPST10]MBF4541098.1 hypothetical protein [Salmonella enterica subsp. enterica serovar Typhimurium]
MIVIEDETKTTMCTIAVDFKSEPMITQGHDTIIIDKHQATQLIKILQRWINGEEIE